MQPRQALLDDDFIHELNMEEYALNAYEQTIRETPVLPDDSPEEKRRREIAYLNIRWFMATLLDRMDRAASLTGIPSRRHGKTSGRCPGIQRSENSICEK